MRLLISLLALTVLFVSCSKDVNINDDWKEIAVIYSLLDPEEDEHFVRVQKVYLGEGDVIEMGTISDSIYYSEDLTVTIQAFENGDAVGEPVVLQDTSLTKDDGGFATEGHLVYKTPQGFGDLNRELDYQIKVVNNVSGYEAHAQTAIMDEFSIEEPFLSSLNLNQSSPLDVVWSKAQNAGVYQLVLRFHYKEDEVPMYIDMPFSQRKASIGNAATIRESFDLKRLYAYLGENLEQTTTKTRIALGVELIVYAGGVDYTLYTDLNATSGTLVEERPDYTNVVNGVGLVSTRTSVSSTENFMNNENIYYNLTPNSIDSLVCGWQMEGLRFAKIEVLGNNQIDTVFCN